MAEIFWIEGNPRPDLAVVARPRGDDWLHAEMAELKAGGLDTLVSLIEKREAEWLGLADERRAAEKAGLQFLSFPIQDGTVPKHVADFRWFVNDLALRVRKGERVGVHCQGSIGRATVTAACTLIHLGWTPDAALRAIEEARGCPVPDTEQQERWILAYEAPG